jgi:hypothetical protein
MLREGIFGLAPAREEAIRGAVLRDDHGGGSVGYEVLEAVAVCVLIVWIEMGVPRMESGGTRSGESGSKG